MSDAADTLTQKKCVPCEGGIPPLTEAESRRLLESLDSGWQLEANQKIHRLFEFKNFEKAMVFVNAVAEVAEAEGHHPDIFIHQWNKVRIDLWTHAVSGLTENDFIVAAKIDQTATV